MEEKYPKSVLIKIRSNFKLTEPEELALTKILTLEGMQTAVEQGLIEAAALLKPSTGEGAPYTVLPESAAKELIDLFQATKTKPQILSKHTKISEFIFWFTFKGVNHTYIPSQNVAELISTNPEKGVQLREFITKNAEAMKIWLEIRAEIIHLNTVPAGKLNERRLKARQISDMLIDPQIASYVADIMGHELLKNEYLSLTKYLHQHLNASIEQLIVRSKDFIIDMFKKSNKLIENPDTDITFHSKPGGKQLGKIMRVKYKDLKDNNTKTIKYYIKTHLGGSSHSHGNTEGVDPKELFIYKVLEHIGYGPKVYFYTNPLSIAGFYLATQDAGFTSIPAKNKFFKTYEDLQYENDFNTISIFEAESKKGVIGIDIISRIFMLTDVATNATNFGRVTVNNVLRKWKIIDFDIRTLTYSDLKIFDGFKAGNGTYYYTENIGKIVRETNLEEKVAIALKIINELESGNPRNNNSHRKMPFIEAVKKAFIYVVNYTKEHPAEMKLNLDERLGELRYANENELWEKLHTLPIEKTGDFGRYVRGNVQNFKLLAEGIRSYQSQDPSLTNDPSSALKPPS